MATLPSPPYFTRTSPKTTIPAYVSARDDGGGARSRQKWTGEAAHFRLIYPRLEAADVATLEAFYDANQNVSFTLDWKGTNYTVIFVGVGRSFDVFSGTLSSGFIECETTGPT